MTTSTKALNRYKILYSFEVSPYYIAGITRNPDWNNRKWASCWIWRERVPSI